MSKPERDDELIQAMLAGLRDGDPADAAERFQRHRKIKPLTPSRKPARVTDQGELDGDDEAK